MTETLENEDLLRLAIGRRGIRRRRLSRALLARLIGQRFEAEEEDEGEEGTGEDEHRIARLLIGSRLLRRRRLRNLLLAHLLRERGEAEDEDDEGEEGSAEDEGRRIARLLIGSRLLRRRRLRNLLLAHLLRERGEAEDEDDEGEESGGEEDEGERDHRLLRLLIGSRMLRRGRARRMLLAHLLREKGESEEESGDSDDEIGEDEGDDDHRLLRALIASRVLRHRRARRMLLAHLLRKKAGVEHEYEEGEEDMGEDGGDKEHRIMRLLIGSRILRRGRARRMLLAHLLRERFEEEA